MSALLEVEESLKKAGFRTLPADSSMRPSFVAAKADVGIVAVDVVTESQDARKNLNLKIAQLRMDIPELSSAAISRRIVDEVAPDTSDELYCLSDVVSGRWLEGLSPQPVSEDVLSSLVVSTSPIFSFDVPRRQELSDSSQISRHAERLVLDAAQASAAQIESTGLTMISGPPGSGKTLVLAARARWLAEKHPEWNIEVLCYNRLLVPYLEHLIGRYSNIQVSTFGRFTSRHGLRVSLSDDDQSRKRASAAIEDAYPCVDAFLVDEWQDFHLEWILLLQAMLFPGRGGITLAGDPMQALYRDVTELPVLSQASEHTVALDRAYRSTKSIMKVAGALEVGDADLTGFDSPSGEPCDLVWADNAAGQADAIARDIQLLLEDGYRARDIAILYTRRWQLGKLVGALKIADIPFSVARPKDAVDLDLDDDSVKLITVHSAKGYEFGTVFLAGLEHLPEPSDEPESARQGRTGYVGVTRARDRLVMTYSKDNTYLTRLRTLSEDSLRRWVWPDDYPDE